MNAQFGNASLPTTSSSPCLPHLTLERLARPPSPLPPRAHPRPSITMMNVPLVPNRRRSMSDPFWAALQPPQNESPADRDRRLFAELEAKRVSDGIDEMLRQERKELRMKQEVKILLLGQSESGKSTTLKREYLLSHFRCPSIVWPAPPSSRSVGPRHVCAESGERICIGEKYFLC